MQSIADRVKLHNGVAMPWLGLGVYKAEEGSEVKEAIASALKVGYRSIDTAAFYGNEQGVGEAVRKADVPRTELFVTTKLWNADQGYDKTLQAFDRSLQLLGLDYVDLYLVHWPNNALLLDTWRAMERIYAHGKAKAIGVSNFEISHLEVLREKADVQPMVNQVEFHPLLTQKPLLEYCKRHHIQMEAWSPLTRGRIFGDPVLKAIADKHKKSEAQVMLRWDLQLGVVTIPKSVKAHRIAENADIFDFSLDVDDMAAIDGLNQDQRFGPKPDDIAAE